MIKIIKDHVVRVKIIFDEMCVSDLQIAAANLTNLCEPEDEIKVSTGPEGELIFQIETEIETEMHTDLV